MSLTSEGSKALAGITIIDAIRRSAVLGLLLLGMVLSFSTFFFYQFIPRDIGQFSVEFIVSISTFIGFLFIFFHCIQTVSWDNEKGTIQSIMARPLSRGDYVGGLFLGLSFLLLVLNAILAIFSYTILVCIQDRVPLYFSTLSVKYFILSYLGIFAIECMLLSVIIFFSSIMRGSFPVFIMTLGYYLTCNGLPVVRESLLLHTSNEFFIKGQFLKWLTLVFPDFSHLAFKHYIISPDLTSSFNSILASFSYSVLYITVFLLLGSYIYQKRDLQ